MIHLYSGTPGSGKSFHATERIFYRLRRGGNVICNYPVNLDYCSYSLFGFWLQKVFKRFRPHKKKLGLFDYVPNNELTVPYLKDYAKKNHKKRRESQTLVVIDECGIMFNPRTFSRSDRLEWIEFLSLHRHYGYDFILVSQSDRMVDRQIRSFFEYNHKHRNVGNFKLFGKLLALFCGGSLFVDVVTFYSLREKVSSNWFRYSYRIAALYDTYLLYDDVEGEEGKGHQTPESPPDADGTPKRSEEGPVSTPADSPGQDVL